MPSDQARLILRLSVIFCTSFLNGCGVSRWSNLKVEATALVDGRTVIASTIWRDRLIDVFPPDAGTQSSLSGLALAIPINSKVYVYGTFLTAVNGNNVSAAPDTILDIYTELFYRNDKQDPPPQSRVDLRDYAVRKLAGRKVAICLSRNIDIAPRDRCPVFALFDDPKRPDTVRQIETHQLERVAGHNIVIKSVTMSFVDNESTQTTRLDMLPTWLRQTDRKFFGIIDKQGGTSKFHTEDFVR